MDKKIKQCKIEEKGFKNIISVAYDDGSKDDKLGSYYPDELYYDEYEFIGLTRQEAIDLMTKRDTAFLRS